MISDDKQLSNVWPGTDVPTVTNILITKNVDPMSGNTKVTLTIKNKLKTYQPDYAEVMFFILGVKSEKPVFMLVMTNYVYDQELETGTFTSYTNHNFGSDLEAIAKINWVVVQKQPVKVSW